MSADSHHGTGAELLTDMHLDSGTCGFCVSSVQELPVGGFIWQNKTVEIEGKKKKKKTVKLMISEVRLLFLSTFWR